METFVQLMLCFPLLGDISGYDLSSREMVALFVDIGEPE